MKVSKLPGAKSIVKYTYICYLAYYLFSKNPVQSNEQITLIIRRYLDMVREKGSDKLLEDLGTLDVLKLLDEDSRLKFRDVEASLHNKLVEQKVEAKLLQKEAEEAAKDGEPSGEFDPDKNFQAVLSRAAQRASRRTAPYIG